MLETGVGDADLGFRDGSKSDERTDLDVVGADAMRGAPERAAAFDRELVGPDAIDLGAERNEEMAEVLNVRLARRVAQHRRSPRRDGGRDRVLGAGDTRLIEKHVGTTQAFGREAEAVVELEAGAETL